MISADILHSTEFYVIMAVLAAAVLGLCVRPSSKGQARAFFYPSTLLASFGGEAAVTFRCLDDGNVELLRTGLLGLVDSAGAVSLAVTITGFDVTIMERITPTGSVAGEPVDAAMFVIDCLAPERYHVRYVAADGAVSVLTLHNRPGIKVGRRISV